MALNIDIISVILSFVEKVDKTVDMLIKDSVFLVFIGLLEF
jgi:hypothetical protein